MAEFKASSSTESDKKHTVSRSEFQKLAEENKRLRRDIETLVVGKDDLKKKEVFLSYLDYLKKKDVMNKFILEALEGKTKINQIIKKSQSCKNK